MCDGQYCFQETFRLPLSRLASVIYRLKSDSGKPMQINRLFEIVYLLLEKGSVTAAALAEHFEVSVRTIYRDIDLLSGAGIPVYCNRGRGGGVSLLPDFVLDKSLLSEREQDEILFALQSIAATHAGGEEVLGRVNTLFRRQGADWIEVDFSHWGWDWGSDEGEKRKFNLLKEAILGRWKLHFTYYSASGEKSERTAAPLKLLFRGGGWYLRAWCETRGAMRTFKICRIDEVSLTQERFEAALFNAAPETQARQNPECEGWHPPLMITLRFVPQMAYQVYDTFCHDSIQTEEDGSLTVRIHVPDDDWIYGMLLQYGEHVRVLDPPQVRKELLDRARKIISFYEENE